MGKKKPVIAVIGDSRIEAGGVCDVFAEKIGCLLVDTGHRLQTGGRGGVMEAAGRGARRSLRWTQGDIIGILPGYDVGEANPYTDIAIPTGLGHGRNMLVVQADAVIAIGGGPGTLSEIAFAWLMNRPIVAMRGPGWAGKLADTSLDVGRSRCTDNPEDRIFGVGSPEEALELVVKLMPLYRKCADIKHLVKGR